MCNGTDLVFKKAVPFCFPDPVSVADLGTSFAAVSLATGSSQAPSGSFTRNTSAKDSRGLAGHCPASALFR